MTPSAKPHTLVFVAAYAVLLAGAVTAAAGWDHWAPLLGVGAGSLIAAGLRGLRAPGQRWRRRRACFHHDRLTGESWIIGRLVDLGRAKHFYCGHCGRYWT